METKLRDMLHDRADLAEAPPEIPSRTQRRARRHRAGAAALGSLAVVLLGLAGYVGVHAIDGTTPLPPATETPTVTPSVTPTVDPGTWPAIWPRETREQTEAAQACADSGAADCTWRIEVQEFMENFAVQALGWVEVGGDDLDLAEPDAPSMDLLITDCTDECFGGQLVEVRIERLVRQDQTGIWSVTSMGQVQRFTDAICTDCPTTDDEVRLFAEEFLRRRQMEVGAEAFLSPDALDRYRARDGGLVLYPYEVDSYGEGFEVVSVTETVDGTWAVEVRLDMSTKEGDVFSSMAELLTVAETSEERPFGYPELIIVEAQLLG